MVEVSTHKKNGIEDELPASIEGDEVLSINNDELPSTEDELLKKGSNDMDLEDINEGDTDFQIIDCQADMNDKNVEVSTSNGDASSIYATKEAHGIFIILGHSDELEMYDKRKQLFKNGNRLASLKMALTNGQAMLQKKVNDTLSTLKEEFETWERTFFQENDLCSPTLSDIENDPYMANVVRKIQVGIQLNKNWNFSS